MLASEPSFVGPWLCPKCRTRFDDDPGRCPHDGRKVVPDLTGRVVGGRYTLKELLGVGGMNSSVWLAIQSNIDRPVAVKMLPHTTHEAAERFARGARIASKLNHPHITVVHDYGHTDDGHLFLVMELLEEGQTLQNAAKAGAVPVERAVHIVDQVLKALDHAHRRQVVHRDIKPANLFLTRRNDDADFVKVLDFGIARWVNDAQDVEGEPHEEITTTRQVCGTPQYMAPEQVASGPVDQRTDLYALGVVFYRLLTGRLPFEERDHTALFMRHLHSAPPPFAATRPELDCPPELEELVMRALAKHPDQRFASADEMRRALRQVRRRLGLVSAEHEDSLASSRGSLAGPWSNTGTHLSPRGRLWVPVFLLLLLGTVGALVVVLAGGPGLRHPPPADPDSVWPSKAQREGLARVALDATVDAAMPDARVPDAALPDAAPEPDAAVVDAAPEPDAHRVRTAWRPVRLDSTPSGAIVRLRERRIGRTPLAFTLPPGPHRLGFSAPGHRPRTITLTVEAGTKPLRQLITLSPRRVAAAPASASAQPASEAAAVRPPTAPATEAPATVRVRLLDEAQPRTFEVGSPSQPASAPSGPVRPNIKIID